LSYTMVDADVRVQLPNPVGFFVQLKVQVS
jgi:hypothetical protein